MLRRTRRFFARPYGPVGNKTQYEIDDVYNRSEQTMADMAHHGQRDWMSMRKLYKLPTRFHPLRAVPRDLGTIPRDYAMRLLFFNQPCTIDTLWELAKNDDICPFDSKRHLRMVLKVAGLQKWVLFEKNLTNNKYYCSVHPEKAKAAQDLQYEHRHRTEQAAIHAEKEQMRQAEQTKVMRGEALDSAIQQMQQQLITNVVKLQEHDPELPKKLECVTESGAVNFHWYEPDRRALPSSAMDDDEEEAEVSK